MTSSRIGGQRRRLRFNRVREKSGVEERVVREKGLKLSLNILSP